jgi:hypothetical protein
MVSSQNLVMISVKRLRCIRAAIKAPTMVSTDPRIVPHTNSEVTNDDRNADISDPWLSLHLE